MFETVLVADHGPVAYRVVRTCQRLGARTVVVHADDDRGAPGVRAADEAVPLGGSGWSDTYGDARKVLEAARRTDAQAVHPGAGPLAEDASLARAVLDAGLAWLGAPPDALERTQQQMADLARSAGLAPAAAAADGRRLVVTTLHDSVLGIREQARREGAPLLDRQPVDLPPEVLRCVEHAALVIARAVGGGPLTAVGLTVDGDAVAVAAVLPVLLLGSSATGEAAGLDLVEAQLRLAAGEPVQDATARRHAMALHLRAGDRFAGRIRRWRMPSPDDLDGVRVDAGVGKGDRVGPTSDRTLAVLTVVADQPDELLRRARTVLDDVVVEGLPTSLPALHAALAHP